MSLRVAVVLATVVAIALGGWIFIRFAPGRHSGGDASGGDPWAHHRGLVPFVVGSEAGLKASSASGKPIAYFFTATWCGWCTKLAEDSFSDTTIVEEMKRFTPVIVDGDAEPALMAKYGIEGFPAFVFVNQSLAPTAKILGYVPRDEFLTKLRQVPR